MGKNRVLDNRIQIKKFLNDMDKIIKQNINELTCDDIYQTYFEFFENLKEFMGNSNGFTGFSEFLIFRSIYHLWGGDFDIKDYPDSNDLKYFVSKNNKYWIGENVGFDVGTNRKKYPDIVICDDNDNILRYIEIKLYPTNGVKTIDSAVDRMKVFKKYHPDMKAMFIMYNNPGVDSKITKTLDRYKNKYEWFDYCLLMDNPEKISDVLRTFLEGI